MSSDSFRMHLGKGRRINNLKRRGAELNLTEEDQRQMYEQALVSGKQITKLPSAQRDEHQSSIQRYGRPLTSSPTIARQTPSS